jgi:hypothetical protein
LESLPAVAAAAHDGALSGEQLGHVAQLADGASDAEWARRAPQVAPVDLARMVRTQQKPTVEEWRARREARSLRMWWSPDKGMLNLRGALADLDGACFEATHQPSDRADEAGHRPTVGQPRPPRRRCARAALQGRESKGGGHAGRGTQAAARRTRPTVGIRHRRRHPVTRRGRREAARQRDHRTSPRRPQRRPRHCRCAVPGAVHQGRPRDPAARRALPLRHVRGAARLADPPPRPPLLGRPTSLPTSPPSAPPPGTTRCSSPPDRGHSSATPTNPTGCASSDTTTSPTNKPATTDSHHLHGWSRIQGCDSPENRQRASEESSESVHRERWAPARRGVGPSGVPLRAG